MPAATPIPALGARRALRLGFHALTDAAPLIVAQERGCFARRGLDVELRREVGRATIRDNVTYANSTPPAARRVSPGHPAGRERFRPFRPPAPVKRLHPLTHRRTMEQTAA